MTQDTAGQAEAREVASRVDLSEVYKEARAAFLNDATNPMDMDGHLVRVAAEHAARLALSARPAVSREAVARLIEPRSWKLHDNAIAKAENLDGEILGSVAAHDERDYARRCVAPSLDKAEAIIQLLQEQGDDGERD